MNDEQAGLLSDGTYRAHWLRAVIRATHIPESVRVLLMTLALHMDASGRVSVPREVLAALLGRNERKVAERVKGALESGLLVRTVRGQKHRVAVYQAAIGGVIPDPLSVPPGEPAEDDVRVPHEGPAEDSQGAGSIHPEPDSQGAGSMHPETQGAGFRMPHGGPAEDSQGAPRGARPSYIGVVVSEDLDHEDSDSLFDLEESSTTQSAEAGKSARTKRPPAGEHPRFAEWYAAYPLRKERAAARKAFNKAVTKVDDVQILFDAAKRYAETDPHVLRGFIKNPATWLNKECWLDEPAPTAAATGTDGRPGQLPTPLPPRVGGYENARNFGRRNQA